MNKEIRNWEEKEGAKFLKKIGIKTGQTVLDFGARVGHYSIPAAAIVGNKGKVYALDKNKDPLNELKRKAAKQRLENITLIKTNGSLETELENNSVDAALAYDVLHLINNRKKLYSEIHRVLQKNGLFSVYPKHNKLDQPEQSLKNLEPKDIIKEIEANNFYFEREHCGLISHDDFLNKGRILNFRKKEIPLRQKIMKKTINGWLFNRIEKIGNKEFNHIGCEGENGSFGDFLASFVPKIGMRRKVKFTVETRDSSGKSGKQALKRRQ